PPRRRRGDRLPVVFRRDRRRQTGGRHGPHHRGRQGLGSAVPAFPLHAGADRQVPHPRHADRARLPPPVLRPHGGDARGGPRRARRGLRIGRRPKASPCLCASLDILLLRQPRFNKIYRRATETTENTEKENKVSSRRKPGSILPATRWWIDGSRLSPG